MDENLKYVIDADDSPLRKALDRVNDQVKSMHSNVTNLTAGMQSSLFKVTAVLAAVGVTALAVDFLGFAKRTIAAAAALDDMSEKTGSTVEKLSALASVAKIGGNDMQQVADAMVKLTKGLTGDEDETKGAGRALAFLNINVQQFKQLDPSDQLKRLADRLTTFKDGAGKTAIALDLFGKAGANLLPYLKDLAEAGTLNAKVTAEQASQAELMEKNWKQIEAAGDVLKKKLVYEMLPALTEISSAMREAAKDGGLLKAALVGLGGLLSKSTIGQALNLDGADDLRRKTEMQGNALKLLGAQLERFTPLAARGDAGAIARVTELRAQIEKLSKEAFATAAELKNSANPPTPDPEKPDLTYTPKTKAKEPAVAKPPSAVQSWDGELNVMKQALAEKNAAEGTFFEFSKERERDFWKAKLTLTATGSKDALGVQAKLTAATLTIQQEAFDQRVAVLKREQAEAEQDFAAKSSIAARELALMTQRYGAESKQAEESRRAIDEIERQARDQRRQLRDLEIAESTAWGLQRIELERQHAQYLADAGLISNAQLLAAQTSFEQQRYDIEAQGLLLRQGLIDPTKKPVEYERINNQLLELERQHQLALAQLQQKSSLESIERYRGMFQQMQSGFASVFKGVLDGTMSIAQGIKGLLRAVTDAITTTLANMAAQWLIQQIAQRVIGKVTALSQVGANAAVAGSAAFASIAAIPFVGPFLAPAAGAAAYAGALSFAAAIPAAEQGYDIPAGVNPITQLHQREMVLPAEQADAVRDMAANGGGAGGSPTFNIQAMDAKSFDRWLRSGAADQIFSALQGTRRNFKGA